MTQPRTVLALVVSLIASLVHGQQPPQPGAAPTSLPPNKPDRYILIRAGTVMAMADRPAALKTTIIVHNDVIEGFSPNFDGPDMSAAVAAGATVTEVDLRDSFVMPGLIDCHVHLTGQWDQGQRLRFVQETDADATVRGTLHARLTLEAGFTTVRDLGANGDSILAIRNGTERGDIPGPRIVAAGKAISITGGHADESNGYRQDLFPNEGIERGVADGPAACAAAVRYQVKRGVDVIKLTATGGVLSASTAGLAQHFSDQELATIIATAHALGRKAAAHAHGVDGINAALRAGVDSIEHGSYLNEESIKLFKEKGAYLVPTLLAARTVSDNARIPGYYLGVVARKAEQVGPRVMEAFRQAHDAGVKIAFGTDTGVSPHGQNAREFALMVQGGMSAQEAIKSATINAADLLGLSAQIGTIEKGKLADIIAVKGDPTKDVTELERVTFVMRSGTVYKNAK